MIRSARAEDAGAIADLLIAQMREHHIERQPAEMLAVVREVLAQPQWGFMRVASLGSSVAGVVYCALILSAEHGGRIGWVEEIYVLPGHRGCGLGQALLLEAIARAREQGWLALELEVDVEHRRAEGLYQRLGFKTLPRSRWVLAL